VEAVERAEAIVAPDGEVHHAIGAAKTPDSISALRSGTRAIEKARGKLREESPERALGIWKGLVVARWTLVDHVESDGRRFVLAQENEPDDSSRAALSPREHQVLANAALGRSNKEIAYALGIGHSTVRVLLTRAAKKLGSKNRAELVRRFEALGPTGRDPERTRCM
jgi:DNA-binding CsgD family transcriptional regulator